MAKLTEIVSKERVLVDGDGRLAPDKAAALSVLAGLLAPALGSTEATVVALLRQREELQSTGIGDGVAVPHAAMDGVAQRAAAMLLCPRGLAFDAIDGRPVHILIGVVGPRSATGEHLRVLARISKLLRDEATRAELIGSVDAEAAFALISARDDAIG